MHAMSDILSVKNFVPIRFHIYFFKSLVSWFVLCFVLCLSFLSSRRTSRRGARARERSTLGGGKKTRTSLQGRTQCFFHFCVTEPKRIWGQLRPASCQNEPNSCFPIIFRASKPVNNTFASSFHEVRHLHNTVVCKPSADIGPVKWGSPA